ncbi:MAG: FISUMP domain-containing protein [bacterium]
MRKTIYILLVLLSYTAYSQSLSVFNVDASNFPTIKANFFALDSNGNQFSNLSPSDFTLKENGVSRVINNISCPEPKPIEAISSVLVMDVSTSMCGGGLDIAKAAANVWIDMLPIGKSECAITSFSNENYINQDFTTNQSKLVCAIDNLNCYGGTDFNSAMIEAVAGGILIAKTGLNKRIIIFMTDGGMNSEPKTSEIIMAAKANNITIYCITIASITQECMKLFSEQTSGLWFEYVTTEDEIRECFQKIKMNTQNISPCNIEWQSTYSCYSEYKMAELKFIPKSITSQFDYKVPNSEVAKLEITPSSVKFLKAIPGIKKDTTITITAKNTDFKVTNITSSNPAYTITPTQFVINSGQSRELTVSYFPTDSGYTFGKFNLENDKCLTKYLVSGGFPGIKAKVKTLKLIQPDGRETFVIGMDTVITWEGVLPEEKVAIEYTTDSGTNWIPIADNVTGLSYNWKIPNTPSHLCLARVTAKLETEYPGCDHGDVLICNQVWLGCNLDVDTYRDGTPIPEVTNRDEWVKLTTGAWCYYENDPAMGAIYGKLYNWYAVNDPRGLAPEGWHIPTDAEWTELSDCLGGEKVAGGKLKSTGTNEIGDGLWSSPNEGATNESGFSGLPGGFRFGTDYTIFAEMGAMGLWWSSDEVTITNAWVRVLNAYDTYLIKSQDKKSAGYSVRCVKN